MTGHGTIISTEEGQGDNVIWIFDAGNGQDAQTGSHNFIANGHNPQEGDIYTIDWDGDGQATLQAQATRATGTISETGVYEVEITDSGDTGVSGTVEIDLSGTYGNNDGFSGEVSVGIVNGKAAYLL